MSIWAQIGNDRVTAIPPDGITSVQVMSEFMFGTTLVPDGTPIFYLVGKGTAPDTADTPQDLINAITPIDGVTLFDPQPRVDAQFVRDEQGNISLRHVAIATIKPIGTSVKDNVTVIAYSTYDRLGLVQRLAFGSVTLTVSSGEGVFLSSIERYDPVGDAWEIKASMPTGRSGAFAGTISNKIYAIGGFNGNFVGNNEVYDPNADAWTTSAPLPIARAFGATVVNGTDLYAIGGYNFSPGRASALVDKFDGTAWTSMSPMPFPLAFMAAQLVGGDIWVLYGATKFSEQNAPTSQNTGVLRYNISGDTWTMEDVISAGAASTNLAGNSSAGDLFINIPPGALPSNGGFLTIDRGLASQETVQYLGVQNDAVTLTVPLAFAHSLGATVDVAALIAPVRYSPNFYWDGGTKINIFNGSDADGTPNGSMDEFDIVSHVSDFPVTPVTAPLPRYKAEQGLIGTKLYVYGGSGKTSDFYSKTESVDTVSNAFVSGLAKMNLARTGGSGAAAMAGSNSYAFSLGGQGSGHTSGWLKIDVTTDPKEVLADGLHTSSISITATDDSGDSPPDGLKFKVRGLLYLKPTKEATTTTTAAATAAVQSSIGSSSASEKNPIPTISIMPVLFSANELSMVSGFASTVLLGRSEDPIDEVQNLANFVKGNEVVPSEAALKQPVDQSHNVQISFGDSRSLYDIAIEVVVDDPTGTFFGQTDTAATTSDTQTKPLGGSAFSFNPPSATQGPSGDVKFTSNIVSLPDVQLVTATPVDSSALGILLDEIGQEVPFGASPHYDALAVGTQSRIVPPTLNPITNLMLSASDNEHSGDISSAADVVDDANSVAGPMQFPIFITTFVVTDPISLAARKERTDVSDLELISSETGGNSFSLDRPEYVPFVITRIKTSAPSSIGSGTVVMTHQITGFLSAVSYTVDNLISGNSATMTVRYGMDGYNFTDLGTVIGPNTTFALGNPVPANFVQYTITLVSESFDSPILTSVTLQFINPSVQYLFTFPQNILGQITELAAVTNQRVPQGAKVEVGFVHGDSLEFERDFASINQPAISDRGTIVAINRNFDTIIDGSVFRDTLVSDDFILYVSKTGPWVADAIATIFVNEQEALPDDFVAVPEQGRVVFKSKLAPTDIVELEVANPSKFRVGLRITNPTLQQGVLDSFAFMYGESDSASGLKPNRPPRATTLFISPSPIPAGGPIQANYTFTDPDGDDEDLSQTELNWFKNGALVPFLKNKRSFTNLDLLTGRADASKDNSISRGQQWFFTVRPSDGKAFGPIAVSAPIVVANTAPVAISVALVSSNDDPQIFTSKDSITVTPVVADSDSDTVAGSTVSFFVNGIQVKSGTDLALSPTEQDDKGNSFIIAGSQIFATYIPFDGTDFGLAVTTSTITVGASAPVVQNVSILPVAPSPASQLTLSYQFVDVDNLQDQSAIAWFVNGTRSTNFDNLTAIPVGNLKPGQQWYAIVTPAAGGVTGDPVQSNTVLIQF